MKKLFAVLFLVTSAAALSFAQQNVSAPQKYALVIGNGAYGSGLSRLNNPINDANDMTAALQSLGFTVDKVLDGNLDQMENAITLLKNRLSVSKNSYGFFFYAGHGVQSDGVNYLIPVGANISSANYLRDRAVSVQSMLGELNDAGNELNIVVLDACRDNPFSWARSGSRGLTVVSNQPADSIIVYATSAGSTAADGTGRNGLFTEHLLKQLKSPGLDVREIFDNTGAAVSQASGRKQIPAIYSQYFGRAYLGPRPAAVNAQTPQPAAPAVATPAPAAQPAAAAKASFDKGVKFIEQSEWDSAIREFTEAVRIDPNYAEAYAWRGRANERKNNNDQAVNDAGRAIQLDSQLAFAYFVRGSAYGKKSDYDRAIADLTQAIKFDPNYAFSYNNRGVAYLNKKDYDSAIADFSEAIKLNPNYINAYSNRGSAYDNKSDYDSAIADLTQAIRLNPKYTNAFLERGVAYYNKRDYDSAIADFTEAVKLDPNFALAYSSRGNVYSAKKDYSRATADHTQAIKLDPNNAIYYCSRAITHFDKKDYDSAIADFTQAIKLDPDYARAYQSRGDAYRAKGDARRANADFAKAKELGYEP